MLKASMPKAKPGRLALALIAVLGVAGAVHADPQAARSAEERRAQKEREKEVQAETKQAEAEAPAALYPQATRTEPETRATAKRTPELQKMFDAFNAKDNATVLQMADTLIADPEANAYERAVSARLAGASQLNVDNAKAKAYLLKAIEFNGLNNNEHFEAMQLVGQLELQAQQYAQSLAMVDRFMSETKTQTPEALALKGNALYRLKRYDEAAAVLKQAVAAPQPKPEWVQLLSATYAEMGKPDEAAKLVEGMGAAAGDDPAAQLNLAATYMQANQDDKAIAILEKLRAAGQLKEDRDYKNLYAMYNNAGGKEKEVIAVINDGMQKGVLKPDYQTYTALAQAYWFSEQPQQAIDAFQKAAPIAPDGEAYLNLARALNNEGRGAEAKAAAKQALAKGVKKPEDANRIIGAK